MQSTTVTELRLIDMLLRQYIQPTMELAPEVFSEDLQEIRARKAEILATMELQGITKKMLGSNKQFAQILRDRGIDPPMKQSPTSIKRGDNPILMTYAFSKTDPEFITLKEDFADDEEISVLLNARTETKSTIGETRNEKLIQKSRHKVLRVPVGYYGAHTGRLTGGDGENFLNMPNTGEYKDKDTGKKKYKSKMRFGIVAPPGHDVINADLAQIEARITACLAGQADLVAEFAAGVDIYSEFATGMFGRLVSKALADIDAQAYKDRKSGKETILGGGFGMGWKKFQRTVRAKGLNLTDEEAQHFITYYRERYPMIKASWGVIDGALRDLVMARQDTQFGPVRFTWQDEKTAAIVLPNGMSLLYPGLKTIRDEHDQIKIVCRHARDKFPRSIWGGVVMENLAQSLARIIIVDCMLAIREETGYNTALQVYDSIAVVTPKSETVFVQKKMEEIMSCSPWWLPDLPVGVESKVGPSFGHV